MKISDSFRNLSRFEMLLWLCSLAIITITFLIGGKREWLTLIASLIGATALIFISRGDVLGQVLTLVFSLLYALISYEFRYYGEMITYLLMTSPSAALSIIEWLRHPYEKGKQEVKVSPLTKKKLVLMVILTITVTIIFYYILKAFNTANLVASTVSVATSFSASYLMIVRSQYYALAYAANDIVLITLWALASIDDISYLPMVACFVIFLINDLYGFYNWKRMRKRQCAA